MRYRIMRTIHRILAAGALAALAGCAQQAYVRTTAAPPRRLEVTIDNASKKDVTDALVSAMVGRDFAIVTITDYTAVFAKPLTEAPAGRAKKMTRAAPQEHRVSFTIVTAGTGVRLVLTNQIVSNPGSAYERVTDASGGASGDSWQEFLNTLPNVFRGRIGVTLDRSCTVSAVTPGSPAATAGIQAGDQMLRVDGAPYTKPDQLIGDPGTKVVVVVARQGKEMPMIIYRKVVSGGMDQQAPPPPAAEPATRPRRK
jgi:membrane-associated protease RseP (regulator of RpoE activity)